MKIAYVAEWNAYVESGVLRKIHAQVRAWASEHEVELFLIKQSHSFANSVRCHMLRITKI